MQSAAKMQFQGFHPSNYTQDYIENQLEEIRHEVSPDANIEAEFRRRDSELKAIVRVYSGRGRMIFFAQSTKLKEVCRKILDQVRKKVGKQREFRKKAPLVLLRESQDQS